MSFFGAFDEDPFMSPRNIFGQMESIMGGMVMGDPFAAHDPFFRGSVPSLAGPAMGLVPFQNNMMQMSPFGPLGNMISPFGPSGNMAAMGGGPCHSYSSTSVMSMSTGPDGRPQVYKASSSSRGGPGGVRETQQSIVDSRRGIRKMAIGRHIDERCHIVEKEMSGSGDVEERQEFINLDEEEAEEFGNEFKNRTQQGRVLTNRQIGHRNRTNPYCQSHPNMLALPAPSRCAPGGPSNRRRGHRM